MVTAVADKRSEERSSAFWNAMAVVLRDATHAAHRARVFKTMAADAFEDCAFNTAHRIKQHPFAAVGAAFAVGVPAGVLIGWIAGRRSTVAHD